MNREAALELAGLRAERDRLRLPAVENRQGAREQLRAVNKRIFELERADHEAAAAQEHARAVITREGQLSLLLILQGKREPSTLDEIAILWLAWGMEAYHQRSIREDLVSIEQFLLEHGLTLRWLPLSWDYLFDHLPRLAEWERTGRWNVNGGRGRGRGSRPRKNLVRDLRHLQALIESGNIANRERVLLAAIHARLTELVADLAAGRIAARSRLETEDYADGRWRSRAKWPEWNDRLFAAYSIMVRHGIKPPAARKLLERILTLLFPFAFSPKDKHSERIRAIVTPRPKGSSPSR